MIRKNRTIQTNNYPLIFVSDTDVCDVSASKLECQHGRLQLALDEPKGSRGGDAKGQSMEAVALSSLVHQSENPFAQRSGANNGAENTTLRFSRAE